jgi:hypothetical protein
MFVIPIPNTVKKFRKVVNVTVKRKAMELKR